MLLLMRSLQFVPANRERFVESAHNSPADVIVLDLEDSVPPAEKEAARAVLATAVPSLKAAGKTVHVRINNIETGLTQADVAAAIAAGAQGFNYPKTESPEEVQQLDAIVSAEEAKNGVETGSVGVVASVESPHSILHCEEIVASSKRLIGIFLGAYDYAVNLGVTRTPQGRELEFGRNMIAHCCAAYGIQALDTVYTDFRDEAGLIAESEYVKSIGFKGKYVIHPSQVGPVNQIFQPAAEEVEKARRQVEAFEAGVAEGHASVQLDGDMIDTPVAQRARDLIALADEIAARTTTATT